MGGWNRGKKTGPRKKENRNSLPICSEATFRGVVHIKTKRGRWEPKHRVVWEKENGPIPHNYVLIFKDGDKRNIDLENLMLVSRRELAIINKKKLLDVANAYRETAVLTGKLIAKTAELERDKNV
ncbi:HNH endonuclease [Enterococcus dispar]|uniref:HNH endonuclease signature motif containing protein n=1 Tax=Enterococcus dispar TaxID=44009 RepID=UPI0021D44FE9|nr:HNH endonuclease signature motif containing protein [Enterococcus dispar]MCU7356274.1 HNH endonuclease [Enterococcus dispar]